MPTCIVDYSACEQSDAALEAEVRLLYIHSGRTKWFLAFVFEFKVVFLYVRIRTSQNIAFALLEYFFPGNFIFSIKLL